VGQTRGETNKYMRIVWLRADVETGCVDKKSSIMSGEKTVRKGRMSKPTAPKAPMVSTVRPERTINKFIIPAI
jgi:hypothetical protein